MKSFFKFIILIPFIVLLFLLLRAVIGNDTKAIFLPNDYRLNAEVADSPKEIAKGLSGRQSIKINQAMLFIYEASDEYCYWMKDMNFSVDIIWLNENKEVVDIEFDVAPSTYPQTFCPSGPARFVIETKSGVAGSAQLKIGSQVNF